jgi:hypothetical protein
MLVLLRKNVDRGKWRYLSEKKLGLVPGADSKNPRRKGMTDTSKDHL